MNRLIKLIKRISVTVTILVLILISINKILEIKYNSKNILKDDWSWDKENKVIYNLSESKFLNREEDLYPLVIRKDEDIPKKTEEEKRILVVGDSYVWGFGGDNINYTWWKQLNLQIKEAGYSNVNVYAAAVSGYNTEEQLNVILKNDKLMEAIEPDLVIMGYVTNDPEIRSGDGTNVIKEEYEIDKEQNELYKLNQNLYHEILNQVNLIGDDDEEKLRQMGSKLGFYRWDIRRLLITEDEHLENYKKVLKDVDSRMKELNIPYFYFQSDHFDNKIVRKANSNIYNLMENLSIKMYHGLVVSDIIKEIDEEVLNAFWINPVDSHPGIGWTFNCAKYVFEVLKEDYSFLFENSKKQDINELELNINDTMPFLNINKIKKNMYEFEYPEKEEVRTENSKFLYYPIEKNYVKINLEFPKNVKKIIVTGESLESAEVYVNTIDSKYGFDFNETNKVLTPCRYILNNTYRVNEEITSVSIVANFKNEENRKIRIEFIEE